MPIYSDAAQRFAAQHYPHLSETRGAAAHGYDAGHAAAFATPATPAATEGHSADANAYAATRWVVDSNGYHEAAEAYDAALAAQPTPPVRLTDPDDPRIRDGATISTTYTIDSSGDSWDAGEIRMWIASGQPVFVLAEAPDPDADALAALDVATLALTDLPERRASPEDVLHCLRHLGWDLVKRES